MVLAASGRIDHDTVVEMAERTFRDLPAPTDPAPLDPARYTGGDFREDRDLEQLHIVLGFEGVGVHDPDYYAHSVLSTLLGGGMSSRLFQEVREKRGLAYSVHTFSGAYEDNGLFGIYAGTDPEKIGELVPVMCDELCKVADDVTDEEVRRARAQLKAGMLMALESTHVALRAAWSADGDLQPAPDHRGDGGKDRCGRCGGGAECRPAAAAEAADRDGAGTSGRA